MPNPPTGMHEKLPGLAASAGRTTFPNGVVLFVDDGVPITDYGEPSKSTGHPITYSDEAGAAAICAALA